MPITDVTLPSCEYTPEPTDYHAQALGVPARYDTVTGMSPTTYGVQFSTDQTSCFLTFGVSHVERGPGHPPAENGLPLPPVH
jgi:hypothetical protein